ncbi:MAG: hypothetical protein OQJ89_14935 [Kangiellaceae bacterium]|nr:hypothetical protein [Kangiellaceae bacterium]MCW9000011.1 hypothetical protein [Kangiellaceae bacterium]MCW9018264.1 hypothetical protein [Kangiellaceae bacterium]
MRKFIIYSAIIATIVFISSGISINSGESNSDQVLDNPIPWEIDNNYVDLLASEDMEIVPTTENGIKFAQCHSTLWKIRGEIDEWRTRKFKVPEVIVQKYSSDEILIALEALQLSTITYLSQLARLPSEPTASQLRFRKNVEQRYPDEFFTTTKSGAKALDIHNFFKRFLEYSDSERALKAENIPLLAEDLITIFTGAFSEDELIEILGYIKDINSSLPNRHGVRDYRLVDAAASRGFLKVFNYLVQRGAIIKNRLVSMNTLEIVIFTHKNEYLPDPKKSNTEGFQQIVQVLLNYDLPVRIRKEAFGNQLNIGGATSLRSFSNPDQETMEFFDNLGIDLTQRITREYFIQEANPALIKELEAHVNRELFRDLPNGKQGAEDCQVLMAKIEKLVNRYNIQETIDEVVADNQGLSDKVIPALAKLEPALVDAYMILEERQAPSNHLSSDSERLFSKIHQLLDKGDLNKARETLNEAEFSTKDKHNFFWGVVRTKIKYINFLVENGVGPEFVDYRSAADLTPEQLNVLLEWDYSFNSVDKRGKSLAFYAAYRCNTELIDYIHKNGYPYHNQQWGEDPLATAIRYATCVKRQGDTKLSKFYKGSVIKSLMKFAPKISMHHMQRMAELKLRDIEKYQHIIGLVPELAVSDSILPSGYYVRPREIWDGVRYR